MQKTNSHIEEDNFREIIKRKLEGYALPAGDDAWNKIEKSLNKERKITLWPWISGVAAAAAVVLFALALHLISDKQIDYTTAHETTNAVSDYPETTDKNVQIETVNQPVATSSIKPERIFVTRKTKGEYAEVSSRPEISVIITEEIVSEKETEVAPPISESHESQQNVPSEQTDRREKLAYPNIDSFGDDFPQTGKKSSSRKSLSLSLGSGNNPTAMNANANNGSIYSNGVIGNLRSDFYEATPESKTEEQLHIEDFPEVTHRAPLSFGLTARKELNRTFSLETGLVYTFLDSRFKNRDWEREALLQLHYIGIPVNIQAQVWEDKQNDWSVYLSAGGMIEKGIYSHYKQTNYSGGNYAMTIVSNEKIDGLQYSVSFAPGVNYKIYRNYSIYFEPKISYYFDNKQPVSARTEHPVVVGINAGLRLYW